MNRKAALLAALALLSACGRGRGKEDDVDLNFAGAENAEEGKVALKGPGFDLSLNVPNMAKHATADKDSSLIYPGSRISGMNIAAGLGTEGDKGQAEVALRFRSDDPPAKLAAWYVDPARKKEFTLGKQSREGDTFAFEGKTGKDGDAFRLRFGPAAGGGTDAAITIHDHH
ncbi:MAG: hypothetical protein E6G94_08215 [Alphaproteobacteria bacterium]|nr:MAG: hypothetical protein E6G94_08215 [Alphaproteobacteria bacterium]